MQVTADDACVTWSVHADRDTIARAHEVAAAAGLEARPRRSTLPRAVIVVEKHGAHAVLDGHRYDSHPGMGLVRVRRYRRGDRFDQLLKATGVGEGDTVLDATFGFGQDALVLACAAGETGRVTALEHSPVLAALAIAGMPHWHPPGNELAQRIDLRHANHTEVLAQLPDRSYDVVVFDPMFRHPKAAAPGFELLRTLADPTPLSAQAVEQARRVARRRVVVKDAWPGRELERLGLEKLGVRPSRTAAFLFGVVPALP